LQSPIAWLNGRANRAWYLVWVVAFYVLSYTLSLWVQPLLVEGGTPKVTVFLIVTLTSLVAGMTFLTQQIRRFHDLGRAGWWVIALNLPTLLLFFTPMVGVVDQDLAMDFVRSQAPPILRWIQKGLVVLLAVPRGQPGENRFGVPHTGRSFGEIFS
jgi:uncharacterized membrane protein YhaH (DUF805 family)